MENNLISPAFSIERAIGDGWEVTKSRMGLLIGMCLVAFIVPMIPGVLLKIVAAKSSGIVMPLVLGLLAALVQFVLQALFHTGLVKAVLKIEDRKEAQFGDLVSTFPLIINYLIASLIMGIAITIGCLLLIVPGIILSIMFAFYLYLIVDKNCGPIESLQESMALTQGHRFQLFLFFLLLFAINVAGTLCLLIGLFVTIPLTATSMAAAYRQLKPASGTAAQAV